MNNNFFWQSLCRAAADAGGGDGGDGGGGDDTAAAPAGDDTLAGGGDDTAAGSGDGAAGSDKWFQDNRFDEATQTQLKALGLTVDDPLDAIKALAGMERAAKQKLTVGPDKLIEKPAEGADVAEWMRQNGELLGVPEAPEGYDIKPPEDWPKDLEWDSAFEAEARKAAHEAGVPGPAFQKMTQLYADKIKGMVHEAESDVQQLQTEMMMELEKDWGDQTNGKITQAQQAAQALAQAAGLDNTALESISAVLRPKIGDANTLRLFAAVGDLAGEDFATALQGGGSMTMTPAEARARIEEMKAPDSAFSKAVREKREKGSSSALKPLQDEWNRLHKIAAR